MTTWRNQYVHVNQYTRPGKKLQGVRKLIVHYTANPGATAANHFGYFDKSAPAAKRFASAHIFVDKTEAICIIPLDEVAYAAGDVQQRDKNGNPYRGVPELLPSANYLSISVELCIEKDGTFHADTIARAVDVFAELCATYKLDPSTDIVRHYDVTHKNCPAPWVADSSKFVEFKRKVAEKLAPPAPAPVTTPPTSEWKVVKVVSAKYGLYSEPLTKWKEAADKYVGWTFVVRRKQTVKDGLWYELYIGDNSYGWISATLTEDVPFKWGVTKEDTVGYLHADLKAVNGTIPKGSKIAILDEQDDKYLVISANQPQWVPKNIVNL
jgi:N-acetylmuramoyl-L-alanine amidase